MGWQATGLATFETFEPLHPAAQELPRHNS
jgi:hypothetical protein